MAFNPRYEQIMAGLTLNQIESFLAKVDRKGEEECWPWKATRSNRNYGVVKFAGIQFIASRVALYLATRKLGEVAMHRCDNPPCCNPAHLTWATNAENQIDCGRKGRRARGQAHGKHTRPESRAAGERNGNAQLTDEQAAEIRKSYSPGLSRTIGERYGVSASVAWCIGTGRTYRSTP